VKRVEYGECRFPWNDLDSQHTWHHECGLRRDHDGPHLCNYCDAEKEKEQLSKSDLEVRQVQMIKALTVELMNARADERRHIREYVTSSIGHCSCCEKVQAFARGDDPSGKRCTCAVRKVTALFNELEARER